MVDQPIAASRARPQRTKILRTLACFTFAWAALAALSNPGFSATGASTAERGSIDPNFIQQAYLKASNTDGGDQFGQAVAMDGDTLVVGAPREESGANMIDGDQFDNTQPDAGAVYVFVRDGTTWTQQAYLKASNAQGTGPGDIDGDEFGTSVSISDDTIVVGAPLEDSNATGVDGNQSNNDAGRSGTAYVFVRNGETWTQQAYLKASNTRAINFFGSSVSISGDLLVVGAPRENSSATGVNNEDGSNATNSPNFGAGAAYVFVRNGAKWSQEAYLKASNTGQGDRFGTAVSISGNTVVIGARAEDSRNSSNPMDNSRISSGAAYVFARDSFGDWAQQAFLKASNVGSLDQFGATVAISGDTIVVGASGEDSNATGVNGPGNNNSLENAGAAYVFVRSGASWSQQAYLKASNSDSVEVPSRTNENVRGGDEPVFEGDGFGKAVSISGDFIVVGADGEDSSANGVDGDQDNNALRNAGAAYLFVRNGTTWSQQNYLKASNTGQEDIFGDAVAISGDTVAVGAPEEDSSATGVNGTEDNNSATNAGATYIFAVDMQTNQPPVAQNDEFLAFEDQVFSGNVFANNGAGQDFDPDDDVFEVQSPSSFTASGIGGSVNLSSDGSFTYTPPAATLGEATFTYTIEDPSGATDSATVFIDVVAGADLVLEKTSGSFFTQPGGTINYEILVVNAGPSDVVGARITDTPPPVLSNVTWDCMAIDGATCQEADGINEIDQTVDIPNGGALMYRLTGTLPSTGNNPITNTASVSNPIIELNPADNSDSDIDLVGLFADGMESEEP